MTVTVSTNLDVVRTIADGRTDLPPDAVYLAGAILDQLDYILPRLDAEAGNGSKTQNDVAIIVKDLNFAFLLLEHVGGVDEAKQVPVGDGSAWDRVMATIVAAAKDLAAHKAEIQAMYATKLTALADHRTERAEQEHVLDLGLPRVAVVADRPRKQRGVLSPVLAVVLVFIATYFLVASCGSDRPTPGPPTHVTQER